tara:strand:+ start:259 stop:444 length:186 start_codon:yes stop_codon:yes gene_type:complete
MATTKQDLFKKDIRISAENNLSDITRQLIPLESMGKGYTPEARLLWDKSRGLTWLIRQLTI